MENFRAAEEHRQGQQYVAEISKEIHRTRGRVAQLHIDQQVWQEACGDREISHPELLIEEKLRDETKRLAGLDSELHATLTQQSKRQRPRSALTCRSITPRTGGITSFSADTQRRPASICTDATELGPRITV